MEFFSAFNFMEFLSAFIVLFAIIDPIEGIKCADWVVDLGPDAGVDGGRVVVAGTPEQVEACEESYTGQYLKIHNERV